VLSTVTSDHLTHITQEIFSQPPKTISSDVYRTSIFYRFIELQFFICWFCEHFTTTLSGHSIPTFV